MRVAWKTGMRIACLIARARWRKGAVRWPMVGISRERPMSVLTLEPMTLT